MRIPSEPARCACGRPGPSRKVRSLESRNPPTLGLILVVLSFLLLSSAVSVDYRIPGSGQQAHPAVAERSAESRAATRPPALGAALPRVNDTLLLWNDTLESGDVTQTNDGFAPSGVAYDANNSLLYVAASGVLSVVNTTTRKVVQSSVSGSGPGIAFDPDNGYVYEGDDSGDVFVFYASNASLQTKIPLLAPYLGAVNQPVVLYVSETQDLYIPSSNSLGDGIVSVINSATNAVTSQVTVGQDPGGATYDPADADVYVGNIGSNNISIISTTTNDLVGTIPVPSGPGSMVYDAATGLLYVADTNSTNVSVIDPASKSVLATIGTAVEPDCLALDPSTGDIYVSDYYNSSLTVVDPVTNSVVTYVSLGPYAFPEGLTYDPSDGELYVADSDQNGLSVVNLGNNTLSGSILTGVYATAAVATPTGFVYVGSGDPPATVFVVALANDSEIGSLALPGLPVSPESLAYDPVDNSVYVADSGTDLVSVIDASTNAVRGPIAIPNSPYSIAVDNITGNVYVTNGGNVTVIAPFTGTIVGNVPVGGDAVAYDDLTNTVYVTNDALGVVYAINATSNVLVGSIELPENLTYFPGAVGITFDPVTEDLYVSDANNGVFYVVSPYTDQVLATDPGGGGVGTFDSGTGYIYDPTFTSVVGSDGSLNVLDPFNNTLVASIPVASQPVAVAAEASLNELFVTSGAEGSLSVVYAPAVPLPPPEAVTFQESGLPGGTQWSVLVDDTNASTTASNITELLEEGIHTFAVPDAAGFEAVPAGGTVTVSQAPLVESIDFAGPYNIAFTESGLPTGSLWSVSLAGIEQSSAGPIISFGVPNGTYGFSVGEIPGYLPTPSSGSVTVSGSAESVGIVFTRSTYSITFPETGLPRGTSWSVTLNGVQQTSTNSAMSFAEPNGSWAYSIAGVAGWHQTTLAYNGDVGVNGEAVTEPTLVFTEVTYLVTFTEQGLPAGTDWYVNISGAPPQSSTGSAIGVAEPNGTAVYTVATTDKEYAPVTPGGSVEVTGASVSEPVTFTLVTFNATIIQAGLPPGTEWWINVTGQPSASSTTATITLDLSNGTYPYEVSTANKSYRSPGGILEITGASSRDRVTFSLVSYAVTLTERGLPTGSEWWVNLTDGASFSSTNTTLVFSEPNGTFFYTAAARGFLSSSGRLEINGGPPAPVVLAFSPTSSSRSATLDYTIIAVLAAVCGGAVLLAWRRRRGRSGPTGPESPPSGPGSTLPPRQP